MTRATGFGQRLRDAIASRGNLCVGIDPHRAILAEWGIPETAAGVERFGLAVVSAAARAGVPAVKPQVAFFEEYGSAGFRALETVLLAAGQAGLLVVADAKRGDIGSSNAGYARAWLGEGAPLACDALTVSPYLGVGALSGLAEAAGASGRGLFVLAATSNAEAASIQSAAVGSRAGRSVAAEVLDQCRAIASGDGGIGVVLGATLDLRERGIDPAALPEEVPVLAPGFGAQGARLEDIDRLFPGARGRVLASVSRSVLAGPAGLLEARILRARDLAGPEQTRRRDGGDTL